MDMIPEPLLTEEGFVCINALEAAIRNIPPTYKRLANDPEWNTKRWLFIHKITGALADYAIQQSPYDWPDGLKKVICYLRACLRLKFDDLVELSLCEINKLLHDILGEMPEVIAWNTSRKTVSLDQNTDFIDIDALFHNVCLSIRQERRANDAFDKKFSDESRT